MVKFENYSCEMKLPPIILLLIICFYTQKSPAQFYLSGEPPASVKWNKLHTSHYNLIYPRSIDSLARVVARELDHYYPMVSNNQNKKRKVEVILHNTSVISNGFVTLAPERMELVSTPPVETYAQDWISQLALHESRHVVQLEMLNRGFTRVFGLATGQISRGLASAMIPSWLFEGDAVVHESLYSNSGRARSAAFLMPLRTLLIQHPRDFSFDKAVFGSYREYVPDHYQYGYVLTRYGTASFGSNLWNDGFHYVARNMPAVWPLAFYLKKRTGMFKSGLYYHAIDSFKTLYSNKKSNINYSEYSSHNSGKKVYTNYIQAHQLSKDSVIAISRGYRDAGSIVAISNGKVRRIVSMGRSLTPRMDYKFQRVVWDETENDPRWAQRSYSVIKMLDMQSGRVKQLTKKSRYFSPSFSPDGKTLCVVEVTLDNSHYITILDLDGRVVQRLQAGSIEVKYPAWLNDTVIAVVAVSNRGKAIETRNLVTGEHKNVMPYQYNEISDLLSHNQYLLYRSNSDGIDNIFAIDTRSGDHIYQITHSLFGAYYPSIGVDSLTLFFSEYAHNGFNIVSVGLDTTRWERKDMEKENLQPVVEADTAVFPASRYSKIGHAFNIHSWLPFYTDMDDLTSSGTDVNISPGFTIFSQNTLGTVISSLGYDYREGYHRIHPSLAIRAWYPVIEFSGTMGGPRQVTPLPEGVTLPGNASPYYAFDMTAYVPLTYTKGNVVLQLRPELGMERGSIWYYENEKLKEGINFAHVKFSSAVFTRLTMQQLYPRWGQTVQVSFTNAPWHAGMFGSYSSLASTSYLPGLAYNHHFLFRAGYQVQGPKRYYLPINRLTFPRGYEKTISEEMMLVSFNYAFTAAYPDWSIPPVLYLKRINLNFFYDHAYGHGLGESRRSYAFINSLGFESWADVHIIRFILPFSAGLRAGYMLHDDKAFAELLFSVDTGIF